MFRLVPLLFALACGGGTDTNTDTDVDSLDGVECAVGAELCECTPGGSCDPGLACDAGICIVPACPVGTLDCPCTGGGACDPGLSCFDDVCEAPAVCGNGAVDRGETCDDGNATTEPCAYGETDCEVCDATCQTVAGLASFCGDGQVDAAEEACDDPSANGRCDYGLTSCEVCNPSTCELVAGATSYCGDGVIDIREECDGDPLCAASCEFIGDDFENNDGIGDAVQVFVRANGTFDHPVDVVHGPGSQSSPFLFEDPDYFVVEDLCANGTLNARIEFDHTGGTLDLLFGRREGFGTPSGPPPVYFKWSAEARFQDFQELSLDAPSSVKDHYILVQADSDSGPYIINSYTLTGSVSCP